MAMLIRWCRQQAHLKRFLTVCLSNTSGNTPTPVLRPVPTSRPTIELSAHPFALKNLRTVCTMHCQGGPLRHQGNCYPPLSTNPAYQLRPTKA